VDEVIPAGNKVDVTIFKLVFRSRYDLSSSHMRDIGFTVRRGLASFLPLAISNITVPRSQLYLEDPGTICYVLALTVQHKSRSLAVAYCRR
jgi:hypothetical protein